MSSRTSPRPQQAHSSGSHRAPEDAAPVLQLQDLQVTYRRRGLAPARAVRGVDLLLHRGESLGLVGESGSGKSTVVRSVLGLLPAGTESSGRVLVQGQDLSRLQPAQRRALIGRRIGYVPQDPGSSLDPLLRIIDQVVEPLRIHRIEERSSWRETALQALRDAGLENAEELAQRWPHELSGGQRQRVLIAAAIVTGPDLVLADEPTSALDVTVQKKILDRLQSLVRERGAALLMITHDLAVAAERTDRVLVMGRGEVLEAGPSLEVLRHPRSPAGQALVEATDLRPAWEDPEAGHPGAGHPGDEDAELLLSAAGVSRSFGSRKAPVRAVRDAELSLRSGGSLAVVGESGSGKTTLARILLGLEKTDAGEVALRQAALAGRTQDFRRAVQPVFQNPHSSFDPAHTVGWSVLEPVRALRRVRRHERAALLERLFEDVGLDPALARRRPRELSGGQLQRAAIARALSVDPEVLVCDEAVSALDVTVQAQILQLLRRLRRERGLALLFITHDLAVVRWLCEDVLVMRRGDVVERGRVREVFEHPRHEYTRELIAAIPRPTAEQAH